MPPRLATLPEMSLRPCLGQTCSIPRETGSQRASSIAPMRVKRAAPKSRFTFFDSSAMSIVFPNPFPIAPRAWLDQMAPMTCLFVSFCRGLTKKALIKLVELITKHFRNVGAGLIGI